MISNRKTQTIVSVCCGDFKSTCFDMACFVIKVPNGDAASGCLIVEECDDGFSWVLATRDAVTSQLMECLCVIGIEPIVARPKQHTFVVRVPGGKKVRIRANASGIRASPRVPVNVTGSPPADTDLLFGGSGESTVKAVRTALVTVSITLTPRSQYGGKNPQTKVVEYFVHNIKYGS